MKARAKRRSVQSEGLCKPALTAKPVEGDFIRTDRPDQLHDPKKQKSPQKRHNRILRIATTTLVAVFAVAILTAGYFWFKFEQTRRDAVPIVSDTGAPADTGGTDLGKGTDRPTGSSLNPITGVPSDLGTDYPVNAESTSKVPIHKKSPIDANVINVVLLSSDARPGETGGRSDSIMVISYNRKNRSIKLASFMRDIWVRIPGHSWDRINAAYAYGGVGLAVNTLNDNFGLDIQSYVTIRFEQFISIINQIGGISLNLSEAEIEFINKAASPPLDTTPGLKQLNGDQALAHARNRSVGNGDFDRTRRQRETVLAILQKVKQQRNPLALVRLIDFTLDNVRTNMTANAVFTLSQEALNADLLSLDQAYIPFEGTWSYADENGRSVIALDLAENRRKLHAFLYGK